MNEDNPTYSEVDNFFPQFRGDFDYDITHGPTTGSIPPPQQQQQQQQQNTNNTSTVSSHVDERPKILLMGLRRSGKSSIQRVVFQKMTPNETLFLQSTQKIEKCDVSECSFIKFQIWDCPGHLNFCDDTFQSEYIFSASCAIIFIIDAQDDYHEALIRLHNTLEEAFRCNLNIKFEVFIHKVDCLRDDQKIDIQRDITQRVTGFVEDLLCGQSMITGVSIGFHLTTIYDHSIFEAFSKVVQKLIPYLDAFENLLDIFITNSMVDKAFLFDVASKIYLATDSNTVDMQTYELCCDMIDVVVDVTSLYAPHSGFVDPPISEQTGATIMLDNDTALYLRGVNEYMALACLMHEESLEKMGLIEYNFRVIKNGLQKMLELNQRRAQEDLASGIIPQLTRPNKSTEAPYNQLPLNMKAFENINEDVDIDEDEEDDEDQRDG